jgi:hypothetical protein
MLYTSSWSRFEITTPVVIGTDFIGSCKSNNHDGPSSLFEWIQDPYIILARYKEIFCSLYIVNYCSTKKNLTSRNVSCADIYLCFVWQVSAKIIYGSWIHSKSELGPSWLLDLQLPMKSVPITTGVVISNLDQDGQEVNCVRGCHWR